jgi:DNA-binding NarL/FixJ family response regulator
VIRVLIVDDHQVVRQGLRFVLEQEDGIEVIGECADGTRALAVIPALRPDVVLLDLLMPGTSGLEVLQSIGRRETRPAFVVLTSFLEDEQVVAEITPASACGAAHTSRRGGSHDPYFGGSSIPLTGGNAARPARRR